MRLGYPCQNLTIQSKMRTCRLATVEKEGMNKVKELTLLNFATVLEIVRWNKENNIFFFRLSSDIVPFGSHPILDWNWWEDEDVLEITEQIKKIKTQENMRFSIHPGQYTVLNSPNEKVVANALRELDYHLKILEVVEGTDMIIHTGGAYGNKDEAKKRFITQYATLPLNVRKVLRLENDDKVYHVKDVLDIYDETGVTICFDIHHHRCNPSGQDVYDVIKAVKKSWKKSDRPKMHISSGRNGRTDSAHHDYILLEDMDELVRGWIFFLSVLTSVSI